VYCAYCYRWPQFVGIEELQFSLRDPDLLREFLRSNPGLRTAIFSGGDVETMSAANIKQWTDILKEFPNIKVVRFGTKALSYWPYRFTTDSDAQQMLDVYRDLIPSGIQVEVMAHFTTPQELRTSAVRQAIRAIQSTGATIHNQFPLLRGVNDDSLVLAELALRCEELGIKQHYVFIDRPTGPHRFFAVPIAKALKIITDANALIKSGTAKFDMAPVMSTEPGKIWVKDLIEEGSEKYLRLKFVQARNSEWEKVIGFSAVPKPGLSWDEVYWLDDLAPREKGSFFFEDDMAERRDKIRTEQSSTGTSPLGH
jgi:L-lysine 2,3-aminomutase